MIKQTIQNLLEKKGYSIIKTSGKEKYRDMEEQFMRYYNQCKTYTRTSIERMYSIYKSVEFITEHDIEGDLVECGTWRGGSAMMMALSLKGFNSLKKNIYLYDTFEGMSAPTDKDVTFDGEAASVLLEASQDDKENSVWCASSVEEVRHNLLNTGYPSEKFQFIKGKVEDTIPVQAPEKISLLRLDTDWYESTYHELKYLYPLLVKNGVLIIDDYGHWKGAREATDNYFHESREIILLNRIDYTGRIGIKS